MIDNVAHDDMQKYHTMGEAFIQSGAIRSSLSAVYINPAPYPRRSTSP